MDQQWIVAAVAAAIGLGGGWWSVRWLHTRDYRYAEEADLPAVSVTWVMPVAAVTAGVLGLTHGGTRPAYAIVLALASVVLITMAAIDLDVRRLPDRLTKPSIPTFAVLLGLAALIDGALDHWYRALLAGVALGAAYLVLVMIGGGSGMGLGDAKLAPTLGMLLGYLGWDFVLFGTFLGFLSGMVWGIWQAVIGRQGRKTTLAFGPHMVIGALLMLALPVVGAVA